MPIGEEFERYYAATQRGQKLVLMDPGETIQSKFPVGDGEVILTQTRLYLATGERQGRVPNVRLQRARPQVFPQDEWLEIAPRMGVYLQRGQTGDEFLEMVDVYRRRALERMETLSRRSRDGIARRYDAILDKAEAHGRAGESRKMKHTLRSLHAAVPERTEAAERLGAAYLEEGNARQAAVWLARAGAFDERFDRALAGVERPRLPSREQPPPEFWIDRNLTPLLERADGPGEEQRCRIRAARERIAEHRAAAGQAPPLAAGLFVMAAMAWFIILMIAPWSTLIVTAVAAVVVGAFATLRDRGRKRKRPR